MTAVVVVIAGVGSQPALGAELTAVPCFVEPLYSYRIHSKEFLSEIIISLIEITAEISSSRGSDVSHSIYEKFHVCNAVFLFQSH